jgi:hypothetical protein
VRRPIFRVWVPVVENAIQETPDRSGYEDVYSDDVGDM